MRITLKNKSLRKTISGFIRLPHIIPPIITTAKTQLRNFSKNVIASALGKILSFRSIEIKNSTNCIQERRYRKNTTLRKLNLYHFTPSVVNVQCLIEKSCHFRFEGHDIQPQGQMTKYFCYNNAL